MSSIFKKFSKQLFVIGTYFNVPNTRVSAFVSDTFSESADAIFLSRCPHTHSSPETLLVPFKIVGQMLFTPQAGRPLRAGVETRAARPGRHSLARPGLAHGVPSAREPSSARRPRWRRRWPERALHVAWRSSAVQTPDRVPACDRPRGSHAGRGLRTTELDKHFIISTRLPRHKVDTLRGRK